MGVWTQNATPYHTPHHRFWSCPVCHGTITSQAVLRPFLVITFLAHFFGHHVLNFSKPPKVSSVMPSGEKHMKFRSHMPTADALLGFWLDSVCNPFWASE